jgi:hypothetical protein
MAQVDGPFPTLWRERLGYCEVYTPMVHWTLPYFGHPMPLIQNPLNLNCLSATGLKAATQSRKAFKIVK